MISSGYQNEINILKELHNKKVSSLKYLYREMILKLYKNISDNDVVYCNVV